jgi:hypothetical protein
MKYKLSKENNLIIAGSIIDLLVGAGAIEPNNPYAVENWAEEYLTNHSNLFATKRFKEED